MIPAFALASLAAAVNFEVWHLTGSIFPKFVFGACTVMAILTLINGVTV
ncbi:hypothetical protein [Pseudaminobacter soli (ex Li et al. 2025)]|nr:hypothetical protein [Mesorhizobium soli]